LKRGVAIGGVALLVAAGVLLALAVSLASGTSLTLFTPTIERRLSDLLQRQVQFAEAPRLRLRRDLTLEIGGLSIADSEPGQPPLLQLRRARIQLLTTSLLRGPLLIQDLQASGLALNLRIDAQGDSNLPAFPEGEDASDTAPFALRLERARIEDVTITREDLRDNTRAELILTRLAQASSRPQEMRVDANGTLQQEPWQLVLQAQSPHALQELRELRATLSGNLADLRFDSELQLPSATDLQDTQLTASIEGTLPPALAALSPLLDADRPLFLSIDARDAEPGIEVTVQLDVPNATLSASGSIDQPGTLDGVDLDFTLSSPNVDPALATVGLPSLDGLPLSAHGSLFRQGRRVVVEELEASLGSHELRAQVTIPDFPDPEDTLANISISGPDASIYPRLLGRELLSGVPYRGELSVQRRDGPELLAATVRVGEDEVKLTGPVGKLPTLGGTSLNWTLTGPSLEPWGRALDVELPSSSYRGSGALAIDERGEITLQSLRLEAATLMLNATGFMDGLPDLGDADLRVTLDAPSLAASAGVLGLKPLAAVPGILELRARGTPQRLQVDDLSLRAGGLRAATREGSLRYGAGGLSSDLVLDVSYSDLGRLLGDYAAPDLLPGPARLTLAPRVTPERFALRIDDMEGQGASGQADISVSRDFTVDAQTRANVDLRFDNPARTFPAPGDLTLTSEPLTVQAETTTGSGKNTEIRFTLSAGASRLSGNLIPPPSKGDPLRLSLQGQGDELRNLLGHPMLPDIALPYSLDIDAELTTASQRATLRAVELAGTSIQGELRIAESGGDIEADIDVPFAELQPWLDHFWPRSASDAPPAPAARDRLIPDTPIPLDFLRNRKLDIALRTGPLGIDDPFKPGNSLLNRVVANVRGDGERFRLDLRELSGGRGAHSGELTLDLSQTPPRYATTLAIRQLPIALVSTAPTLDAAPLHDADATLSAGGDTLRELAASLDGQLLLNGGAGTLKKMSLSLITGSFLQELLGAMLPMLNSPEDVAVQCTVLGARANSGVITLDPGFVMRTKRVDLSARGEIDLSQERLRIRFDNQARTGIGISAASLVNPYLQITGTFARPVLGLDVASSTIAGGAAIATGGLTTIVKPLVGRFLDKRNPCKTALSRWESQG
jgi:uncharacterized protein involved in outer membrane biogenesis